MKRIFRILGMIAVMVLCVGLHAVWAQNPTFGDLPDVTQLTPENIFAQLVDPIYSGLIVLFGYVAYLIPGVNKLTPFVRVIAFGLVAGLGFHLFGASIWKIATSYIFSTLIVYDGLLSNIFKSKNPPAVAPIN